MITVNRTAALIKPSQVFLDWLHEADPSSAELPLEALQSDASIYLIPDCDCDEEAYRYLEEASEVIFEEQLSSWLDEPETWPEDRGLKALSEWFEITLHSMLVDLSDAPIVKEFLSVP